MHRIVATVGVALSFRAPAADPFAICYDLGDPPSLKSEFTTCFLASKTKYMYKPVSRLLLALSDYLKLSPGRYTKRCSHRSWLQRALTPCASEQSRLRPWPSAAIWRACGTTFGLSHEARLHGGPTRGQSSITRPARNRSRKTRTNKNTNEGRGGRWLSHLPSPGGVKLTARPQGHHC
jgi:hypothetical protein